MLSFDEAGSVASLTVGSGARFNAMDLDQWRELADAARSLVSSRSVRAVVVRGQGGTFSSGSDLREWTGLTQDQVSGSFADIEDALQAIESIPVPTVAVVEGVAAGGGCQLALACDLQLMSASARIGMPTAKLGILVPVSFAHRLSVRIGPSRAKDLLYGGRLVTADEASAMGLVTSAVADDLLDGELTALLTRWGAQSVAALRAAKAAVNRATAPLDEPARSIGIGVTSDTEFTSRVEAFLHRP
jgi:enoyl-CoA hydratase/carnithine racemase